MGSLDKVRPDSEAYDTLPKYADYARRDDQPGAPYLLERSERPVSDHSVETSCYYTREAHELEKQRLWSRTWLMACRANEIPEVGDYVEFKLLDWSILVVRSAPDRIQAFHNACRHRGTQVAKGCGNVHEFSCPFHGWVYGLDGALKEIPGSWDFDYLDKAKTGLVELKAGAFDGWVYVNLDKDAEPLEDYLGETVMRHLKESPDEAMWKSWHLAMVVPCNWKVLAEAFCEAYHIARTHPSLAGAANDLGTQYDSYGLHHRLCTLQGVPCYVGGGDFTDEDVLRNMQQASGARFVAEGEVLTPRAAASRQMRELMATRNIDISKTCDSELIDGILYGIFPNFMPFRAASGHYAYRFTPHDDSPEACLFEIINLTPLPKGAERPKDVPLHMMKPGETFADYPEQFGVLGGLIDEDVNNAPLIQKGLHSLDRVFFAKTQEANIIHFHRNIEKYLSKA